MKVWKLVKWFFFGLAVVALLYFGLTQRVMADDERNDIDFDYTGGDTIVNDGDVNVPVHVTGGTQSVTGSNYNSTSRALALGNSMGDVDIAGCLGSTQWSTPLIGHQKLVLNWPCMAEFYIRNQMWENAAMAICNTEIRQEFASEQECRDAHPFQMLAQPVYEAAVVVTEADNDEELELYNDRLQMQQEAYEGLQQEMADLRARPAQRVVIKQDPELVRRLDQEAQRRAKARAILEGEK